MAEHRSGVVALLGLPNAGKSSLLNRWIGQKLAIVTPKPQTTRSRILGILTRPDAQALVLDTPGLVAGTKGPLDAILRAQVAETAEDCDVALLLVDLGRGWEPLHDELRGLLEGRTVIEVGTKCDRFPDAPGPETRISARTGEGCEELLERVIAALPEGPPFYPAEDVTDRSLRFLVAELVREAAFEALDEEVPYGVAVEVESFDESRPDLVRIRARLLVARASHKRIAVGAGGAKIKEIGTRARREIEKLLERKVHLELWVKPDPGWTKRPKHVESLGYR